MEAIAAGSFGLLIGLVGLWTGFRQLRNRRALDLWPQTAGTVIERGIYQPNTPTMSAAAFRFAPLVKYSYQVNGKEYVNDCLYPKRIQMPEHSSRKWAQKKLESFPDQVTVYYNPADPSESYLVQVKKWTLYLVLVVSVGAMMYGAVWLLIR